MTERIRVSRVLAAKELAVAGLKAGCSTWLTVNRSSMEPTLLPGDRVLVTPVDTNLLKTGDVVALTSSAGIIIHRLTRIGEGGLVTQGDRSKIRDVPWSCDCLLGKVTQCQRNESPFSLPEPLSFGVKSALQANPWYFSQRTRVLHARVSEIPVTVLYPQEFSNNRIVARLLNTWRDEACPSPWLIEYRAKQIDNGKKGQAQITLTKDGDKVFVRGSRFSGEIDFLHRHCIFEISPRDHDASMENAFRVFMACVLCRTGKGIVLHASGIATNGIGYVFAGKSGSGKSTLASLSKRHDRHIISDDLIAITKQNDGFYVSGMPFHGNHKDAECRNVTVPLKKILFLSKSEHISVDSVDAKVAVACSASLVPFVHQLSELSQHVLSFVESISYAVGFGRLRFAKNPDFWRFLEEPERGV